MSSRNLEKYKDRILEAIKDSKSMSEAAVKSGIAFTTFKRYAKELSVYNTNQSGKGLSKRNNGSKIPIQAILEGKHPQYQTYKLKMRLLDEGILEDKCSLCGLENEWMGKPLSIQLDHINGDRGDHRLDNLRMLCPNCHAQTETYRGKNINKH